MSDTYTRVDEPGFSLDALRQTLEELEALLPEMLYRTHDYVPRTSDGKPFFASLPEYSFDLGGTTGRRIVFLHPDNLELLRLKVKGLYRLVEWTQ